MTIEHPEKFNATELEDLFLWKYLDIFKLIDIIGSKKLYFTRFDHFEDGLEGLTGRSVDLMAFTQGNPLTEENINPALTEEQQIREIENDRQIRQELDNQLNKSQKSQYASCWFLDNRESLAMWKIYSKKEGVAIKFKAKELSETIIASAEAFTKTNFTTLYYGKVDYKNIWPFDPHEEFEEEFNGLKKDRSYSSENEFRFVAVVPTKNCGVHHHFKLPIGPLSNFDLEIIANPFMEDWQFEGLRQILTNYNLDKSITRSKMKIRK